MPRPFLMTYSIPLRVNLAVNSEHITVFPASVLRFNRDGLGLLALPVELPPQVWPIAIVTLRNRTLNPAAELFCGHIRAFLKTLATRLEETSAASRSVDARGS
jgi:DNA-binding transcriptional LysR family regulator